MKTQDAISHFGTQTALAKALGITQPTVAEWGEYPPPLRQLQIQQITVGQLQAEPNVFVTKNSVAAA